MQTTQQGELVELWSRVHATSPALRGAALLDNSEAGLSWEELCRLSIGKRDQQLLAMRSVLFRDQVAAVAECPECRTALDLEFRLSDLDVSPAVREADEPMRIIMDEYDVTFRLPTSEDLTFLTRSMHVGRARRALLARCVLRAALCGSDVGSAELPEQVVEAIARRMGEADPAGDINLQLDCPGCSHRWNAPFDIAAFLWTEVDAFVRRRLAEVHELASAYSWAESEILSMPTARRDFYLRMVRA